MKRVRQEGADPGEDESVQSTTATHPPNEFGQWLLENIYKYAKIRDSEELVKLKKEKEVLEERCADLVLALQYGWRPRDMKWFCAGCWDTRLPDNESGRPLCSRCLETPVSCTRCIPQFCRRGLHRICQFCVDTPFVSCSGRDVLQCTP
jgi:hypothetical protein